MNQPTFQRRPVLRSLLGSSLLLPGILSELMASPEAAPDPLAPKTPHFAPRAKRVIFLFMTGGASHVDSFDFKPRLIRDHGKPDPAGKSLKYMRPLWEFKPRGQSGLQISELFPHIASCADDLCVIRSMKGDHGDHFEATLGIHTGSITFTRPSLGSWITYGLGTEDANLPAFLILAPNMPYAGAQVWSSDFLPGVYQGTRVAPGAEPMPNIRRREPNAKLQELEMGLLRSYNQRHLRSRPAEQALAARIQSFETGFRMQSAAPEAFDLAHESDATLRLYGLERGSTRGFAWQCLVARRLAERGVRFIELIDVGSSRNWDAHEDMKTHVPLARNVDQPIAALLKDLKSRGMLDDTLVVWTTEFGRTPTGEGNRGIGRSHHATAFSTWLAGGGVKGGFAYGKSDDYGHQVVENLVRVHDLHATILHLLGLDHKRLTYRHAGRDFRLTDVHGEVVTDILA